MSGKGSDATDGPVALPPNKRRRRESFEADHFPASHPAVSNPELNVVSGLPKRVEINHTASVAKEAQNTRQTDERTQWRPPEHDNHTSAMSLTDREHAMTNTMPTERNIKEENGISQPRAVNPFPVPQKQQHGDDNANHLGHTACEVTPDLRGRSLTATHNMYAPGDTGVRATVAKPAPDVQSIPNEMRQSNRLHQQQHPNHYTHPETHVSPSSHPSLPRTGLGVSSSDDVKGQVGANGAPDHGETSPGYPSTDRRRGRPPGPSSPQQQHISAVLSPEVANVLNGLFERGFFEERDIDGRAIDFLGSVSPDLALAALEDIQHRDFSTVRNKPAFIFSIFKRVVSLGGVAPPSMAPPGGFPPTTVPASALAHLPTPVSDALQRVFASGVCHPSQFDDRAMDILVELHPSDAVRALSEFAAMEPGRVRNPSAFWMGLARKFSANTGNSRGGPAFPAAPPGVPSSGTYDAERYSPPREADRRQGYVHDTPSGFSLLDVRLEELMNMGILRRDSLDERASDALRKLPEQDALTVLAELPDPARVRNMSAYVMGLCKKFMTGEARSLTVGRGPSSGYVGAGEVEGGVVGTVGVYSSDNRELHEALGHMGPEVSGRFYEMVDRGMFPEHAFDHRAVAALKLMNIDEACAVLDELAASDPRRIHNISAYFMGLARKFGRA